MFIFLRSRIALYLVFEKRVFSSEVYKCNSKIKTQYKMIK